MKPPYTITNKILSLISCISEQIGAINATYLDKQSPQLRKQNKIKTIHSSLQIEGNTLTEEQVTAIIENKRVIGTKKDILEVVNAITVYNDLSSLKATSEKDFLRAHQLLMKNLMLHNGQYRKQGVGIVKGSKVKHIAPPYKNVPYLMKDLFTYLKKDDGLPLIKSCVVHYEIEFIHPFTDGNGRMGRLWQTVLLKDAYPVFEFLPFETLISKNQDSYYKALAVSDKQGSSTCFIEFMLDVIHQSLTTLMEYNNRVLKDTDRLEYFIAKHITIFTRKDYMNMFKDLSPATASRDLKKGIMLGYFEKNGDKNLTVYKVKYEE
jgi:Fic family protein